MRSAIVWRLRILHHLKCTQMIPVETCVSASGSHRCECTEMPDLSSGREKYREQKESWQQKSLSLTQS